MFQLAVIGAVLITGLITAAIALHIFDARNQFPVAATTGQPGRNVAKTLHPTSISARDPRSDNRLSWRVTVDPSFTTTVDPTLHGEPPMATLNHPIECGRFISDR